jgi:hypothetical protein
VRYLNRTYRLLPTRCNRIVANMAEICYISMLMKCSVKRCGSTAAVRGLCRKHYMRLRRNGDAALTKLPGPKPREDDPSEELARMLVRDRSPRTLARCRRASTLLMALSPKSRKRYVARSMVDGAMNVSKLLRLVEDEVVRRRITAARGSHRTVAQALLANSDSRARFLRVALKAIRAWRRNE